ALTAVAAVGAGLALVALYGRNPHLALSPFASANPSFLQLPAALPFLLLAAAAAVLRHGGAGPDSDAPADDALPRPPAPRTVARALYAVGLLWGTAVLLLPDFFLGVARHPLATAVHLLTTGVTTDLLAGICLLALATAAAAGWVWAIGSLRHPGAPAPRLVFAAPIALAAYHVLAGALTHALLPGLLLAASLGLATLLAHAVARAPRAFSPRAWRLSGRIGDVALLTGALVVFFLLKTHGMGASNTDENIYFYMAADLAHGRLPYVDYFFAHPPLHVLLPGLFFTVFGFSLTFAKLFSVAAAAITGAAVFAIGRRHLGRTAAILAAVLFLFAAETLKASTNMTGINLTTMWLALGLWQHLEGRGLTAGLMFGAAATTGFYSMAAVLALLVLGLFRRPEAARGARERFRFGLRQLAGFALVFATINGIFIVVAGDAYLESVYAYHGMKALRDARMVELFGGDVAFPLSLLHNIGVMVGGKEFTKELFYEAHLWIGLFAAPVVGAAAYFFSSERRRLLAFFNPARFYADGPGGVAAILWLVSLALFAQYAMFRELYSFYFVLAYPTLALCVAFALVHGVRLAASAVGELERHRAAAPRLVAGALALAVVASYRPWSASLQGVFSDEIEATAARNDYTWTDAPVLPALSGFVRAWFWEDYRLKGDIEPGYRHYLWTKKRGFESLDEVAAWVREHTTQTDTIAGASTMAPLVALAADRRLAADEADTNNKRFKTGLLDEATYWNAICADHIKVIVATSRSYFTPERMDTMPTAKRWFRRAAVILDDELTYGGKYPIALYERVGPPPSGDRVCQWETP
ncbi:MAG: hypothetical protein CVU56_29720, partial [Deltaproteobacteria bacterium HGW-Deltaproteobacteria-14]